MSKSMIKIKMQSKSFPYRRLYPKNQDQELLTELLEDFRGCLLEDYWDYVRSLWYPRDPKLGGYNFDRAHVLRRGKEMGLWF